MTDIRVNFLHPSDGGILGVILNDSITAEEAVMELIAAKFITPSQEGYLLAIKGGALLQSQESFAYAGVVNDAIISILPITSAGGDTEVKGESNSEKGNKETSIPGLRKTIHDTFTIQDIVSSPQATTMIVHMYDDLQLKYERQSKHLEHEITRSNNNFTSTILLLISQVILSIGSNLLTSNQLIAIPVMIAGALQTSVALYLTFGKRKILR
jgi:hypothetical protein